MKRSCFCTWLPVLLLAAFLLLLPSAAEADTVSSGDFAGGLFWSLNEDGQLTISGEGAMPEENGELPWWSWPYMVRSVVIEDGVTTVTPYAFSWHEQLESVTLGSTVTTIGEGAFEGCYALKEIHFSEGLISIGDVAFYNCDALTELAFPDTLVSIGADAFENCDAIEKLTFPDSLTHIGDFAFFICTNLEQVTFGSGLTAIGEYAFYTCGNLKEIRLPAGLETIGKSAFSGCSALTTIYVSEENPNFCADSRGVLFDKAKTTLLLAPGLSGEYAVPGTVTQIQPEAFYGSGVTKVTIPAGVTTIGEYAFEACRALAGIWVDAANTAYSSDSYGVLFDKEKTVLIQAPCGLTGTYAIPTGVTALGSYAFSHCSNLTGITIPEGVSSIGSGAFSYCVGLQTLVIPEGVTQLQYSTFVACQELTSVSLPGSLREILSSNFVECPKLTDVYFRGDAQQFGQIELGDYNESLAQARIHIGSATVTGVAVNTLPEKMTYAPYEEVDLTGLTLTVTLSDGTSFTATRGYNPESAWMEPGIHTISVNYWGLTTTFQVAAQQIDAGICGDSLTWTLDSAGLLTISGTGAMWDFAEYEMPWCAYNSEIRAIVIEEGVTSVGDHAFQERYSVESISLPESLASIGKCAFSYCGELEQLTFGSNLTHIGEDAFYGCKLTRGYCVSDENPAFASDAWGVLFNKEKTKVLGTPRSISGAYEIPATVTAMELSAFQDCAGLTEITVPAGLTNLGEAPFGGCPDLEAIWVAADNAAYCSDASGVLFDRDQTTLLRAPANLQGVYTIPQGVKLLAETAFSGCKGLTGVVFSDSVTEIGWMCFAICEDLQTVTLGSGMEYIHGSAFCECTSLTSITIPAGVWEVNNMAFEGCTGLQAIWVVPENPYYASDARGVLLNKQMTELICAPAVLSGAYSIPETVTVIWSHGFNGCADLTSITLPGSLTKVGYDAFKDCNGLENVYFAGSEAQWDQIAMEEGNEALTNAAVHFEEKEEEEDPVVLTGMTVETLPDKTEYIRGESLDLTGLTLKLTYSDGSTRVIEEGFQVSGLSSATSGKQTLTVTYEGFTATFTVTVKPIILASGTCGDNLTWTLDELGLLTISGTGVMYSYDNAYNYSPWYSYHGITTIVVENGVTSIGTAAFADCYATSVSLPEGLTAIGKYAFENCVFLENITIPETVNYIGDWAFSSSGLTSIRLPQGITAIPWNCFLWCDALETVELPASLTTIDQGAFHGCSALKSIAIPEGVTTIGAEAFQYCYALESIVIPDGVTSVGLRAFEGSGLMYITIGKGLTAISEDAFLCSDLVGFTVSPDNAVFSSDQDGVLFNKDKTTLIKAPAMMAGAYPVPEGVQTIANNAFANTHLTAVILPDSVTTLGSEAFIYSQLQEVVLGKGVTAIDTRTFAWCGNLRSVTLPDSLTYIGYQAFHKCANLESIVIPNSVTTISAGAFGFCENLKKVTLSKNLTAIPDECFWACKSLTSITLPSGITSIGGTAFNGCQSLKSITIPTSVTSIGGYAFQECNSLTSVTIPNGVTSIGNRAFGDCSQLAKVTLGSGVTDLGEYAFASCTALRTVEFLGDPPTIGANAFYGVSASVYTSVSNGSWSEQESYGGDLSWSVKAFVQLLSQPKSQTAYTDTRVTFTVTASGDIAAYQWQYSKDGGKSWYNSSSATQGYNTNSLTVAVTMARNGFKYRCRITDTDGGYHYSSAATLTSKKANVFIESQPSDQNKKEGENAIFRVAASGEVAAYRWQYSTNGGATWNSSSSATQGYNTPVLTVEATLARNGFLYRCRITDNDGNYYYTNAVTLSVKKLALTFLQQPQDAAVKQGNQASFTVAVEETGVTYQWQYSVNGIFWSNSTIYTTGYDQPTLYVTAAAKRDGFLYRCRITDGNGNKFYSQVATLDVLLPQQSAFASQPVSRYVIVGNQAVFSVTTQGSIASIQWQYQVKENDAWYNSSSATQGYNTATLIVNATTARNNFGYRCVITDSNGYIHISNEVRLYITKAEITAEPGDQTAEQDTAVVFSANVIGDVQKVYWQHSSDGGKSWYNSSLSGYNTNAMTVKATQARNGNLYRLVVIDAEGNRINSSPAKLTVQKTLLTIPEATELGLSMAHNVFTTEKFKVTGVITEVYNATYGNMRITDEAGNIFTIYGTYSADGLFRYDAMTVKPVAGDTVTVYGVLGQFNGTAQMKNGWIIAHTPGEHEQPSPEAPGSGTALTIAEALELGADQGTGMYTSAKYKLTGTIVSITNTTYGNLYIQDENGNAILIYGTYSADGTVRYDGLAVKPAVGDTITVYGIIGNHNGTPQMKNGWIEAHIVAEAPGTEPEGESATITFEDVSNRILGDTTQQVWQENGITVTNLKATSNSNVNTGYLNPIRCYQNSSLEVAFSGMTKLIFTCSDASYAQNLANSISDATVSVTANMVTVELSNAADSFFVGNLVKQVRISSIQVFWA